MDKDDKNVRLVMPMFNYGKEDIENARAFLKIFDTQNNLIKELETLGTSIEKRLAGKIKRRLAGREYRGLLCNGLHRL